MVKNVFDPRGHGIREILLSTRGYGHPHDSVLTQEDLANLYAIDPFRRCGFCKVRTGFIWIPPFSAHASDLQITLVTWKDGRKIIPRAACFACVDGWFNGACGFSDIPHPAPWDVVLES